MANLIGTGLNQVPTNGLLGNMAFQNKEAVSMDLLGVSGNASVLGDVGIGTASPGVKLDVIGTIRSKNAAGDVGGLRFWSDVSGNGNIFEYFNASLIFGTGDTERMRINASGNVGVGVAPTSWAATYRALEVRTASIYDTPAGTSSGFTFNSYFNGTNWIYKGTGGNATALRYEQAFGQHQWFTAPNGAGGATITWTQAMTLETSGNLGLGVTPSAWGSTFKALQINTTDNGAVSAPYLQLFSNAFFNGTNYIYSTTGAATRFDTRPGGNAGFAWHIANSGTAGNAITFTQAMTLDASGNLLLGSASNPDGAKIFVNAGTQIGASLSAVGGAGAEVVALKLYANASATASARISFSTAANTASHSFISAQTLSATDSTLTFGTNNTERMRITSSGDVGIGTTSTFNNAAYTNLTVGGSKRGIIAVKNASNADIGYLYAASDNTTTLEASGIAALRLIAIGAHPVTFRTNDLERMRVTADGNIQVGTPSLATNATNGFPYIPTCAGTPTGTPTAITGYAPMVVDSTNNKLYVYVGGAWQAMN